MEWYSHGKSQVLGENPAQSSRFPTRKSQEMPKLHETNLFPISHGTQSVSITPTVS